MAERRVSCRFLSKDPFELPASMLMELGPGRVAFLSLNDHADKLAGKPLPKDVWCLVADAEQAGCKKVRVFEGEGEGRFLFERLIHVPAWG